MKKFLLLIASVFLSALAFAAHITGGEMFYTLVSQGGGSYTYEVTLKLYRDCFSTGAQLDPNAVIAIYNNTTGAMVSSQTVSRARIDKLNLGSPSACIQNPPVVCYEVGYYTFTVILPATAAGYTVAYQRCCRITGINNLVNSSTVGATYTATIPGTNALAAAPANHSARFTGIDTVIICANNSFCYDFGAVDPDGDSLTYSFCNAYVGGSQNTPAPSPPGAPPYTSVPYATPYSSSSPLGAGVSINPRTGLMCGIAPSAGIYVVTVCVSEYRNGVLIATQRKDLQIKVGDCNVAKAAPAIFDINGIRIQPSGAGCRSFTYTFLNDVPPNPLIQTYYWETSDGSVYNTANPTHTFADTGVYAIKLVINRGLDCSDSVTTTLKIYPGFFPGFTFVGYCATKQTRFFDTSKTIYGAVNSWSWNFGDDAAQGDTSHFPNPTYSFPQAGNYNVQLIVTSSKGCIDTVRKQVAILTKPPLSFAFKDTLICNGDSVQLHAIGTGNFTWTPVSRIINQNTADPTVFPTTTTRYIVRLDDQGCLNQDTVRVRVVDFVTLQAMPDTIICSGDTLRLHANTDGLRFLWSPAATIIGNASALTPLARPTGNTTYTIQSIIGRCNATDEVNVTLVPYPIANAGADTIVCYDTPAQLTGSTDGSSFNWSPATSLANANTLTPIATPKQTTPYVLTVYDTRGCPKPGRDTVVVTVNPEVFANAGKDTAVVVDQPLQFNATGGESYSWTPTVALSNTSIANPIGKYDGSFDSIRYFVTVRDAIGCSDVATVLVKIFKTAPQVFVPTAFTPNGDGKNDLLRPIAVGLTRLDYFRIFNRWGQLVFETTVNGKGWDGKISGKEQGTSTYVWIVKGTDFTGKVVFQKGTTTLIR